MSNLTSANSSEEADESLNVLSSTSDGSSAHQEQPLPTPNKKRRKLPGNPDPSAKVIALSPTTLMATNRFICEVCNKGFQREQNLQLHRRGHNLPWKLKQKTSNDVEKRVYICPESSCIHHNPARALGDLTGIKKHFSRKHGEKKWKCDKCSKKYAVQSDWKAHSKTCGTKEYKCDCGTIFSRRDSFVTHRAFCDALAEENNKVNQLASGTQPAATGTGNTELTPQLLSSNSMLNLLQINNSNMKNLPIPSNMAGSMFSSSSSFNQPSTNSPNLSSATLLLQQAAQMGATVSSNMNSPINVVRKSYNYPFNGMQIPILRSDHDHIQAQIGSNNIVHGFVGSTLQNSGNDHQKTSRLMQIETGWYNNANNTLFNEKQRILNKESGHSNEDGLTLDFLGITGRRQGNLHEMPQQQEMNPFEHQKEVGQQSIQVENSMWDD